MKAAAIIAALIGNLFSVMLVSVCLAMWPGVLLGPVGNAIGMALVMLLGPAQLISLVRRRFGLVLLLFGAQVGLHLMAMSRLLSIGPMVCTWGPYHGLMDCGLPHQ